MMGGALTAFVLLNCLVYCATRHSKMRVVTYLHEFEACPNVEMTTKLNLTIDRISKEDFRLFMNMTLSRQYQQFGGKFVMKKCTSKTLEDCQEHMAFDFDDTCKPIQGNHEYNKQFLNKFEPPISSCPVQGTYVLNDFPGEVAASIMKKILGIGENGDDSVYISDFIAKTENETILCIRMVISFGLVKTKV